MTQKQAAELLLPILEKLKKEGVSYEVSLKGEGWRYVWFHPPVPCPKPQKK